MAGTSGGAELSKDVKRLLLAVDRRDVGEGQQIWRSIKPSLIMALTSHAGDEALLILAREGLEAACLLHVLSGDVEEIDRCCHLLEPLYNSGLTEGGGATRERVAAVELLRLLTAGRMGDFRVKLEKLLSQRQGEEAPAIQLQFVAQLEQCIMAGNYEKAADLLRNPVSPELEFFCCQLRQSLRFRIADCFAKSHSEIPLDQAQKLLMFDTREELEAFIDHLNQRRSNGATLNAENGNSSTPSARGGAGAQEDEEDDDDDQVNADSCSVQWRVMGDHKMIKLNAATERVRAIPSDKILAHMTGYATELERIV